MGPLRNDDAIQAFFDQWDLYRRLIDYDYMAHRGIHGVLRESLSSTRKSPFSVLDLGSGDGSVMAKTLRGLPVQTYTGVDLSQVALDLGKKIFADSNFDATFIQSNLLDYLARPDIEKVDVVIAGFTLHHLQPDEKRRFFSDCMAKLSGRGDLYVFDVFKMPGQIREDYLNSYCGTIERGWSKLSAQEIESICEHIRANDFPASFEELSALAQEAGFHTPDRPLYADAGGFHRLCRFNIKD